MKSKIIGVVRILCAMIGTLHCGAVFAQSHWTWNDVPRVVAFGDVHGAHDELVELLIAAKVIDSTQNWIGGPTHLVSLGDLLDRGPDSRAVMDLLMDLQIEAEAAGGRVHVVLGNHELMNLMGDLRYVSAGEYAAFAPDETNEMRQLAFDLFVAESGNPVNASLDQFNETYPPGFFAHRAAFARDGKYGQWLLQLPAIVVVNESAFVHGGLPPIVTELASLSALNTEIQRLANRYLELREDLVALGVLSTIDPSDDFERARAAQSLPREEITAASEEFLDIATSPLLSESGPFWYRGTVFCKPIFEETILQSALSHVDAKRVVVGHTPTENRQVASMHQGRLIMLDTGMLASFYNGQSIALELDDDELHVVSVNPNNTEKYAYSPQVQSIGLTDSQLRTAMTEGAIASINQRSPTSSTVTIEFNGKTLQAAFMARGNGGNLELAAAKLDELLGTDLVPTTVERDIEGVKGVLQIRANNAVTENQRLQRQIGIPSWCPIENQIALLNAFNALTANKILSLDDIFYLNRMADLTVTDYADAFGTDRSTSETPSAELPAVFLAALRAADEDSIESELSALLDRRRLRALLARRLQLLGD